uniref:Uncharacterized protein n=1 Tax=Lophocladia kuetzingii TaxID=675577 RepID=A0A1Z1MPA6_9FLOR|nr:hypothetical protein [Lophocladia kuetzingii]ARW67682.1 hypothetical protein [Lophocladia kuetzingii]
MIIIAATFYPKSLECVIIEELQKELKEKKGKNYCKTYIKNKDARLIIKKYEMENYAWYRGNIGEIHIDKLIKLREKYDKNNKDKRRMKELIKLIINTIYGDLSSPYFYTAIQS